MRSFSATLPRMRLLRHLTPRFSIRAMLVVTTLCALFCGYHIIWMQQRRAAFETGWVMHGDSSRRRVPAAPGFLWLFGEKGHFCIVIANTPSNEELGMVQALFSEAEIDMPSIESSNLPLNEQ